MRATSQAPTTRGHAAGATGTPLSSGQRHPSVRPPHLPLLRRLRAWVRSETAVMHVTHWKAGSQWIKKILGECCPNCVIPGGLNSVNLTAAPIRRGAVYTPVYAARQTLDQMNLPPFVRRFAVIRDPRDTLVSLYYSTKISHDIIAPVIRERRDLLQAVDVDKGLQYLIRESTAVGDIIRSWLGGPDPVIRYEDLLGNDEAILERVLLEHCQLAVSRKTLLKAIRNNRFEALTKGRRRGEEDVAAHERKGIAGDWRNHFSEATKQTFKECFGNILVEAGYETSNDW